MKYNIRVHKNYKLMFYEKIYNLLINVRVANKRTNLGNMYFENTYTSKNIIANVNTTWLIK